MSAITSPLLPYEVAICGLDELDRYCARGISHAVSLLDPDWPDPQPLHHVDGLVRRIFRFHDIIDEDGGMVAPALADVQALLHLGEALQDAPVRCLLVHCHAGVSRSTAAAAVLLAQFRPGCEDEAFREVGRVRPWSWPNSRMVEFADRLLGRRGLLVAAMRAHHARMIATWPDLAATLKEGNRAREYLMAG